MEELNVASKNKEHKTLKPNSSHNIQVPLTCNFGDISRTFVRSRHESSGSPLKQKNTATDKQPTRPSCMYLQPLTKILRQIADLQQKLTFQAIWKVLIFSLEMTRLLKIEKWLEASALGCHPARNGHVTH